MLGFLLWECISKKAEWVDKLEFALLAISMSVFYGLYIYGIIATRKQARKFRLQRFMLCLQLIFYLASFLVGFFIARRAQVG